MKQEIQDLIKTEQRRSDFGFIIETVQRGRIRPAKFRHQIAMPIFLYEELRNRGVINPEDYYIEQTAFFEFKTGEATISFLNLYNCEDLHRRIDYYLVKKFAGSYPIKRNGISKL